MFFQWGNSHWIESRVYMETKNENKQQEENRRNLIILLKVNYYVHITFILQGASCITGRWLSLINVTVKDNAIKLVISGANKTINHCSPRKLWLSFDVNALFYVNKNVLRKKNVIIIPILWIFEFPPGGTQNEVTMDFKLNSVRYSSVLWYFDSHPFGPLFETCNKRFDFVLFVKGQGCTWTPSLTMN